MKRTLEGILSALRDGMDAEDAVRMAFEYYDKLYDRISDVGASLIEDGDGILTRCFPEHTFMLSVAKAAEAGHKASVYVPETRPYLQGSRLTEPSLRAMGIECFIITDGMNASMMADGRISKVMTASDLALPDRTIVNKTGTLSDAICAHYYSIPYYAFSLSFDKTKAYHDIPIEYRDSEEVKSVRGVMTAEPDAKALYPCFDIIPPSLVSGIIMEDGIV